MLTRMFFALIGLGAGVALGIWSIRKLESAGQRLAPENVARRAGERASGLGARLAGAVAQGRLAAEAKEAELRAAYGIGRNGRGGESDGVG